MFPTPASFASTLSSLRSVLRGLRHVHSKAHGRFTACEVANGDGGEVSLWLLTREGKWAQVTRFEDKIAKASFADDGALYLMSVDKAPNGKGAVYMWVEELDANNIPSGYPRSYRLAYTEPLEEDAEGAQERRENGEEVLGQVEEMTEEQRLALENKNKQMGPENEDAEQNAAADTVPFMEQDMRVNFQDLPPIIIPDKGAL